MKPVINLVGKKFGRLKVIQQGRSRTTPCGQRRTQWWCICSCGRKTIIGAADLKTGHTKSCGCLQTENRITHGRSKSRTYQAWCNIKSRCYNSKDPGYANYGGRGIQMCTAWKNSFKAFYKSIGELLEGQCLDRKDNNGDYTPKNVRIVTPLVNNRNSSKCKFWVVNGHRFSSLETAATRFEVHHTTILAWCDGRMMKGKWYPPRLNCWSEIKNPQRNRKNKRSESEKMIAKKHLEAYEYAPVNLG